GRPALRWRGVPMSTNTIPEPRQSFSATMHDGAVILVRRFGNPDGPRLVLSHGNGLAIDGYFEFWRMLVDRYDLVLFDMRNHGRNPLHPIDGHNWTNFVSDIERLFNEINRQFGAMRSAGVFH